MTFQITMHDHEYEAWAILFTTWYRKHSRMQLFSAFQRLCVVLSDKNIQVHYKSSAISLNTLLSFWK